MYKYPYGDSQQLNLDWILAKIKDMEAAEASDLETISKALISLTYNTSTAYRRYDYAFLNGKLYRCLTDTSGVFNPTAWQEALIGDDLAVLTRWINAIDAAAVVDVKFDTSGTNGKIQQKYHDQYHDVVEVDYTPVQNSKRPLSSNAGYELNGAIKSIKNITSTSKALLIGDSYNYGSGGTQPYGWGYYLQQLSGATCDIVHQNGGGFTTAGASIATYPDKTYVQLVADLDASKNYDFIIVQTGQNDANHGSVTTINTAVPAFMTAIKAKYPNAIIYIIPVFNDAYVDNAKNEILLAVAKKALENGARTCFNSWFWLINSGVNSSYANHLTDDGYQLLAKYMLQFINGWAGDCNFQLNSQAELMGISELSSAFHNRGSAIETVMNSLMIFHGFYTVPNDIAADTKILQLRDSYTYRDTVNIYISSTSGAKYFTLDVHTDGSIYSRTAIAATDTSDPYEVWIIVSVTPNTYQPT